MERGAFTGKYAIEVGLWKAMLQNPKPQNPSTREAPITNIQTTDRRGYW
jgi:hypothetical protein